MRSSDILSVPFKDELIDENYNVTNSWMQFFSKVFELVFSLGQERSFLLGNNKVTPQDLVGLSFLSERVSFALVEYIVQRVTTGVGATQLIEAGTLRLVWKPTSSTWELTEMPSPGPDNAGIVFSVSADGQVKYTTTNITGSPSISKITYRARVLNAKNNQYSKQGLGS
jgi:hypothetical protein